MNIRIIVLFAIVSSVLSCQQLSQPAELTAQEEALIAEEVDIRVREYIKSMQSLEEDNMLSFWADVEGFAMAGDGALLVNYEEWADQIKTMVKTTAEVNYVEISNPHVYVLTKDAASYSMEFKWSITSKEGETTNATGSWTYVLKRFPEGWKVVHSAGTHIYS